MRAPLYLRVFVCEWVRARICVGVCEARRVLIAYNLLYLFSILLVEYDNRQILDTCNVAICANQINDMHIYTSVDLTNTHSDHKYHELNYVIKTTNLIHTSLSLSLY
jgi:hypothetical protein